MISGKVENWKESRKLALRTELATGFIVVDGVKLEFCVTMNIDNKAFFVEMGDWKVTYLLTDMVEDGLKLIKAEMKRK